MGTDRRARPTIRRLGVATLTVVLGLSVVPNAVSRAGANTPPPTLMGIACKGPSFCVVVGRSSLEPFRPFIGHYDGARWRNSPSPVVSGGALYGVACPSASNCFAVGGRGGSKHALIEHWDGTAWHIAPSPKPSGFSSSLRNVTCVSAKFCVAVGASFTNDGKTLIEHWNGTRWKIVPSPNRTNPNGGMNDSELSGVSCANASMCFAVGWAHVGSNDDTYILRWNGHAWSFSTHQNLNGDIERLFDVSCPTAKKCIAVGETDDSIPNRAVRDVWDGKTWHLTASHATNNNVVFTGVSCTSTTSCLAVGARDFEGTYSEYFNGSTWKTQTPGPVHTDRVTCVQPRSCYAVGDESGVAHWNGSSWKGVTTF